MHSPLNSYFHFTISPLLQWKHTIWIIIIIKTRHIVKTLLNNLKLFKHLKREKIVREKSIPRVYILIQDQLDLFHDHNLIRYFCGSNLHWSCFFHIIIKQPVSPGNGFFAIANQEYVKIICSVSGK
ncbi:hypothetical protein MBMB1_0157 [Methanobacterium sp. MB1]|nr:hypothetical protein MBMB1_0157 [Methanobacterium sp. MB1]